jgi:hypothetical protein
MDIVVWLRSLGLRRYEAAFRENEIDETVLPSLTAEDLKELGVTALGHRRKLLDATASNGHRAASFDHLVGDGVHTRRDSQPERLCGPEVDDKLEFGRQFDRQVTAFARPQ